MGNFGVAAAIFALMFSAAIAAMLIRDRLPPHHLDERSKDTIKVGMGLVATMSALVLSLLVASAKTSYDAQAAEVRQTAALISQLDRLLADYGPDAAPIRTMVHANITHLTEQVWRAGASRVTVLRDKQLDAGGWSIHKKIHELAPSDDLRRELRTLALQITVDLTRTRWRLLAAEGSSIPLPFLIILIFWLVVLFASFALFAPWNLTVLGCLAVGALSVAAAIFLILELDRPFEGMMQISSTPLRNAIERAAR